MASNFDFIKRCKIKMRKSVCFLFIINTVLSGCGIGGHWMNGNPFPKPDIPYISYWQKEGMTEESRINDWVACKGDSGGGVSINSQDVLPGESQREYQDRQMKDFQRCLIRSGYRYTGNCKSDWSKTRPACGAP